MPFDRSSYFVFYMHIHFLFNILKHSFLIVVDVENYIDVQIRRRKRNVMVSVYDIELEYK